MLHFVVVMSIPPGWANTFYMDVSVVVFTVRHFESTYSNISFSRKTKRFVSALKMYTKRDISNANIDAIA